MIRNFLKAARLRTLPLSISGIIIGCKLGFDDSLLSKVSGTVLNTSLFWFALATTIGFQVLSNFANDYGDGVKGSDKNRIGEKRMVASGLISAKQMKMAMIITTVIAVFFTLILIFTAFGKEYFAYSVLFFILGISAVFAAIKYTVGKSAYGYSGFGDIFVFLFFGLLSVVGSYFLFTKNINFKIFLPAITIGMLSTAVLNLNNLRDVNEDRKNNKNTLVVKLGLEKAKKYHFFLIISALVTALLYVFLTYNSIYQFVFLIAFIPLIKNISTVIKNKDQSELDKELKKVALSTFLFALLFAFSQNF